MEPTLAARIVFRGRNVAAGLPVVFAFVSTRWVWDNPWGVWTSAVVLCGIGVLLRSWAVAHCGYAARVKKTLAVGGPYRIVRNPLYWGNLFIILGGVAATGLPWLVPVAGIWAFLVFHLVVLGEEVRLQVRYGSEFLEYLGRVPRWFPRRSPPRKELCEGGFLPVMSSRVAMQLTGFIVLVPGLVKQLHLLERLLGADATGSTG